MARYETSLSIPVPLALTFDYVSNFEHAGTWDPRVSAARRTDGDGPIGVGSRFELDSPGPLWTTIVFPYEIVQFERATHVVFEGQTSTASYRDDLRFEALSETSTKLTYTAKFNLRGVLKIGSPIMAAFFQRIGDDATQGIPDAVVKGTGWTP